MAVVLTLDGREIVLLPGVFFIGRGEDADLRLDDPGVSRRHAALRVTGDDAEVEDLGSRNGLLLNGRAVRGVEPLEPGDVLTIGEHELRVRSPGFPDASDTGTRPLRTPPPRPPVPEPGSVGSLGLLSPREQEVLKLVASGLSQREIAERLDISIKTLETYRTRLTEKLGLGTRAAIIKYALSTGLLRPE